MNEHLQGQKCSISCVVVLCVCSVITENSDDTHAEAKHAA